ncbi:hypothetical protein SLA2020_306650 [Shorea laevis]
MRPSLFNKRLETLYSTWKNFKEDRWGNSDVLVIYIPPEDSLPHDDTHQISSSFLNWLIGDGFPGTVAFFAQNEIFFLCTNNKSLSFYRTLVGSSTEAVHAGVCIKARKVKNEDLLAVVDKVLRVMKAKYRAEEPLIIGCISREIPQSRIFWNCMQKLKQNQYQIAIVNDGFTWLCAINHKKLRSVDFDIQMQSLPEKVEEMLSMSPKAEEQKPSQALFVAQEMNQTPHNSEQKGRIGVDISLQGERREESSCGDGDEDEWVLVDADEKVKQIERARKDYIWKRLPLS